MMLNGYEMVEGMTGQRIVITKPSTIWVKLLDGGRCHRVVRGGRKSPKEGTATMHKTTVQSEPKVGMAEKRG